MGTAAPKVKHITTDILIIGGGTAGCMAAIFARQKAPQVDVTIFEKAHINRSGCLAMGLNAVNAYLVDSTPEDYLRYVLKDNYDVLRSDLVLSIGKRLNRMTRLLEEFGVPLPRGEDGKYIPRSARSIVMLGEHLKPILAQTVQAQGVKVFNRTPAYRLLKSANDGSTAGAVAFNLRTGEFIVARAKAVIIATGGASGIYRPSNPGLARTKTWYCPYNAGSGLAMGLRAGAEMTSFEMRFVALRTKDVIAPTGTLVLGTRMPQCNARGEKYLRAKEDMLGRKLTTCERLLHTIDEHKKGKGPCYVDVSALSPKQYTDLVESYLNMAPSIILDLLKDPARPRSASKSAAQSRISMAATAWRVSGLMKTAEPRLPGSMQQATLPAGRLKNISPAVLPKQRWQWKISCRDGNQAYNQTLPSTQRSRPFLNCSHHSAPSTT